ncbi:uncharacterized protein Z518_08873 [Rhinocladiella mackenziei CBS 650.93]|uniref:Uncharacterized protein n=1 Tax=Rhinocladiella mackenziei CBS 650.93 TaxID=1442369 RepID=A0A0D2GS53_9EURO|nr:uncharacterized protein Z518_08873 [Rhinocladiella mackenziei CBS 650.93]KIX01148.1 hypothetical protein Z518_08873 [Rhinocladiella mackenziei CBS 650.93]
MDDILLPIIYEYYSSFHVQHYSSSYDHSRYNATARGVETRGQRIDPISREQQLMSYLPSEQWPRVWESILIAVQRPAFRQFRDVTILLQAKNLKVLTKDTTWERMMTRFSQYWFGAVNEEYVTSNFYFDMATEICPTQASRVASSIRVPDTQAELDDHRDHSETLLWKRCCLENWKSWIQQGPAQDSTGKEVFYPLSILQDSGSLTVETSPRSWLRAGGLLFSQRYPSVKEIFAAGHIYPFSNTAIETLALDKSLQRTWELVGGGLSHNPTALMKAYLYTKLRCHFGLRGSVRKSFGVRTEYRVSRELFEAIDRQFRLRPQHHRLLTCSSGAHAPYYRFTTTTLIRWLRWNINKFCVGFEMVHSFQDAHFVTWEHTRMMLAFLRCLQFSCPSGLIQKVGGCWHDVRFRPDSRQTDGLQRVEGLGFRRTMEEFGYGWFLDKIDWVTLTFRPPHAAHMMFNNPSMQAAYHARYGQVRDVRLDFIRMGRQAISDALSTKLLRRDGGSRSSSCSNVATGAQKVIHSESLDDAISSKERIYAER